MRTSITAPGFSFFFLKTLVSTTLPFDAATVLAPRGQPEPLQVTLAWPPAGTPDTTSFLTVVNFLVAAHFAAIELLRGVSGVCCWLPGCWLPGVCCWLPGGVCCC